MATSTMTPEEIAEWEQKCAEGTLFANPIVGFPEHGTSARYGWHGCRCAECRAWNAARTRAWYALNSPIVTARRRELRALDRSVA